MSWLILGLFLWPAGSAAPRLAYAYSYQHSAAHLLSLPAQQTRLILLGTGTPNADPDRSGPALAVVVDSSVYLVDAGPGVVRRAVAAGLDVKRLNRVFLTHLHSDHTVGLPDLLLTPWVLERADPLEVFGPEGTGEMMRHIELAYREDVRRRIEGLQPQNQTGWRAVVREISPGLAYRDEKVEVTAFLVEHEDWPLAFGYRFDTKDRSIVVSGDARPSESVVQACRGCDILVHEVYSAEAFRRREPEWQRYHAAAHTSAVELAALARRAQPKLLVLTHLLLWGQTPAGLLEEIRQAGYDGPVVVGSDLDVF
ncbi:MAG: ribonuclease Z [Gemmatimonadales bacterium]|nr:MAG: ribonuclease Z [Gemmatimonadales bacterium]